LSIISIQLFIIINLGFLLLAALYFDQHSGPLELAAACDMWNRRRALFVAALVLLANPAFASRGLSQDGEQCEEVELGYQILIRTGEGPSNSEFPLGLMVGDSGEAIFKATEVSPSDGEAVYQLCKKGTIGLIFPGLQLAAACKQPPLLAKSYKSFSLASSPSMHMQMVLHVQTFLRCFRSFSSASLFFFSPFPKGN
jgi:hypothetical protein